MAKALRTMAAMVTWKFSVSIETTEMTTMMTMMSARWRMYASPSRTCPFARAARGRS